MRSWKSLKKRQVDLTWVAAIIKTSPIFFSGITLQAGTLFHCLPFQLDFKIASKLLLGKQLFTTFSRSLANSQRSLAVFESCYEPHSLNVQVKVGCFPPFLMTLTCAAWEKQLARNITALRKERSTLKRCELWAQGITQLPECLPRIHGDQWCLNPELGYKPLVPLLRS